ncbi:VCL1 [Scenedesmus sp. PABB004]|nr:VCL1 [Scenedesmus sp. PABB004]
MTSTALASLRADAVSDWEACGDSFYCQEHLYDLHWQDVDLEVQRVAAAPFGGPLAVMRDESALVVVPRGAPAGGRPVVRIFSAAGALLGSFLWEGARLAGWGWSAELELVMVDAAGKVYFYSLHGECLAKQVSFGPEVEAEGVSHVALYPDGLVVLGAASGQLWAVVGLAAPRAARLPRVPGLDEAAAGGGGADGAGGGVCLGILEPRFTLSGGLEVLVACGETVWTVDDHRATDSPLPPGCGGVAGLAVAPSGTFVALACGDGRLRVMSSDFSQQLCEFDTNSVAPTSLAWCGVDAVALAWAGLLLLVGPTGEWQRLPCAPGCVLVSEVDGLRMVDAGAMSLLRRVPDPLVQAYPPGSTAPPAQLLDARDLFDSGSARADRLLRQLGPALPQAVEACAAGAGLELVVPRQRALLRAAVFGRAFAPSVPPGLLRETALKLRVLNALREPKVGLPLTMPQLEALTLPVVVGRLVALRQHLLAYRIAEALGTGQQEVLLAWACAKISASPTLQDGPLKEAVAAKMGRLPRPRYAPLAAHAQARRAAAAARCAPGRARLRGRSRLRPRARAAAVATTTASAAAAQALGRRSLAIKLLEEEPSPAAQVPLLLSLARTGAGGGGGGHGAPPPLGGDPADDTLGAALRKAVESGDPDLVHLALFEAYRARPLPEFWALVSPRAPARNLFAKFTRLKDPELLETLYVTQHLNAEAGELALEGALRQLVPSGGGAPGGAGRPDDAAVAACISGLQAAGHKFGQCKELAWQAKAAAEAAALLKEQVRLERDTGQALFVGLPLADTVGLCLRLGHARAAAGLRKSFGVPEPRWYWIKLRALAAAHDWDALDAWLGEKRSPIGWEPFVREATAAGAPREALARLISRAPDCRAKADAFEAAGCPREAAEVAAKLRDGDLLARIGGAVAPNSAAGLAIAQLREAFQAR